MKVWHGAVLLMSHEGREPLQRGLLVHRRLLLLLLSGISWSCGLHLYRWAPGAVPPARDPGALAAANSLAGDPRVA